MHVSKLARKPWVIDHLPDVGIPCALLEWLQVVFSQFLGVDLCVKVVAIGSTPVFKVISREMLASCNHLLVFGVWTALETADESSYVALQMKWI